MYIKAMHPDLKHPYRIQAILCVCIWLSGLLQTTMAGAEENKFRLDEIAPGIYLHQGVTVDFADPRHDDIANIGFIVGARCVAVIDTGGSVKTGDALRSAIRGITDLPVCYVINTHVHFDHVLGNLSFAGDKSEFIGHAGLADAIEASRTFFLKEFSAELGGSPSEKSIIGPARVVTDRMSLDLGGRKLLLTAWPAAHTHADLTVLDEQTGTLWTGDLLFREHVPVLDGSLKGWLSVIKTLKTIAVKKIIPGHGPPGNTWTEVMTAQENYLNSLLQETRKAIAGGVFMEDAINTIGREEKDHWLLFEQHHRANVSKAFVELEWE
jgi:quinoprotein relay system zinc metallohydrolase 2